MKMKAANNIAMSCHMWHKRRVDKFVGNKSASEQITCSVCMRKEMVRRHFVLWV